MPTVYRMQEVREADGCLSPEETSTSVERAAIQRAEDYVRG